MKKPRNPPPDAAARPFASSGRSRKGEAWIWLCAAGLAIGVVMTAALLSLVVWKGVESFWPRRIALMKIQGEDGAAESTAGYVVRTRLRRAADGGRVEEVQLFRGNRDLHGEAFRYVDSARVEVVGQPADLWLVERMEHGNAIGRPVAWIGADGEPRPAGHGFEAWVSGRIDQADDRRSELKRIERREIGAVNRRLEELRIAAGGDPAGAAATAAEAALLQSRYEELAAEARAIRGRLEAERLVLAAADGREFDVSLASLVDVYAANRPGVLGRLGEMLKRVWGFLSEEPRDANTGGGVFPAIFGTVVMTLVMTLFATPLGVIAAIYLREYARQGMLVRAVRISVNNLAGVPSIVFGVFGLAFFVYFVGGAIDEWFFPGKLPTPTYGTAGILWASLTLALLTLPVVIVATEEAIAAVPRGVREAALACGASKWQTIQRIVLPASLPGILTGVILAMARGAGEVAPLMIVGVVKYSPSLPIDDVAPFIHPERKFMHLGFHIYDLGFQSPDSEAAMPMVFATTLLLILIVVVMNLAAIIVRNRLRKRYAVSHF